MLRCRVLLVGACSVLRAAMMAGEARGLVSLGAGKRAWRAVVASLSAACLRVAEHFCAVFWLCYC